MERILVVRFSSLGDIVLTEPVIAALKVKYPEAHIDYLTHARFTPVVQRFASSPDAIVPFPDAVGALELPGFARDLSHQRYDLMIDLHNSFRSKLLRKIVAARILRIYLKPRQKRFLLFYLWMDRFESGFSVVDEYLRYAELGRGEQRVYPRMTPHQEHEHSALAANGLAPGFIAVVPGAAVPQKIWPAERYRELLTGLLAAGPASIVLFGAAGDDVCDEIASHYSTDRVVNLKGKTSLHEALALLGAATVVVGSDTGLVHAAQAMGVPAALILGPTSWQTGAAQQHPDSVTHEVQLWCRPCSQNGRRRCYRREQYCLTGTTAKQVLTSVLPMVGGRA